jgi:DNA-binding NarL/FixJ family response regulator
MFQKIIVAEDIDSISIGLKSLLSELQPKEVIYSKYCEEAYLKIKKGVLDKTPFDLLITDLSFKKNREEKITSGEELISVLNKEEIPIKIIVYSIEEKGYKIRHLLDDLDIDGYVSKGRDSAHDLLNAINEVYLGNKFISPHLAHLKKPGEITEIDELDLEIIKLLSQGLNQPDIEKSLRKIGKRSASLSSIEKRIIKMKASLLANNTTHLVSIAKDMGLI